jgi:CheY-like chemotaxis protein
MNSPQQPSQSIVTPDCASGESCSSGLLLSRDLIFTTKIKATAAELGYKIQVARDVVRAESLIAQEQPRVVLLDLTAGDLCAPSAVCVYRKLAGADAWFVAFGPHVEADALAAAKAAGCQTVIPRSKFASELPKLIQQYFGQSP